MWMLAWSLVAAQAEEPLDCDFVVKAVGVIPVDVLVDAIEQTLRVDPTLLGCAERAEAPAAVVDAIRRRLGLATDRVDAPWVPVDTADPSWPERLGRTLAEAVQVVDPGEVPMVVLFHRPMDAPNPPWWYLELRDRVASKLLERLPDPSAAAESPSVLDAAALDLLDADLALDLHDRLLRMGYRRVLILQERPVPGTDATDVDLEVRNLDSDSVRTGLVRLLPATATLPPPGAVRVKVLATPSPAAPGVPLTLEVAPVKDPLPDGPVEVWSGGQRLAVLLQADGDPPGWRGVIDVPMEVDNPWPVHIVHPTEEGGTGWLRVEVPIKAGASEDGPTRRLSGAYDDATRTVRRRGGGKTVKRVGVIAGAGVGGGLDLFDDGGQDLALADEPWTVGYVSYRDVAFQSELWRTVPYVRVPVEVAVQVPGVRVGAHLGLRPSVNGDVPRSEGVAPGGATITRNPTFATDLGGSLLFGARNPIVGGWVGPFVEWQWRTARAEAADQTAILRGNRGVLGVQLSFDRDIKRNVGLGIDFRSVLMRFGGTTSERASLATQVDGAIRVFYRLR